MINPLGQIFETWSLQNQDLVQAAAHSYGERIVSSCRIQEVWEATATHYYETHWNATFCYRQFNM